MSESAFDRVCQNIKDMMEIKKRDNLPMCRYANGFNAEDGDQIIPLSWEKN